MINKTDTNDGQQEITIVFIVLNVIIEINKDF